MMERSIPLGRGGTPDEAAGAVYLFCIPESDYVSGQTLMCSGGLTGHLMPCCRSCTAIAGWTTRSKPSATRCAASSPPSWCRT